MSDDVVMATNRLCVRTLLVSWGWETLRGVERGRYVVILGFVDFQFFFALSYDLCWWLVTLVGFL